jgi:hypothetical protein
MYAFLVRAEADEGFVRHSKSTGRLTSNSCFAGARFAKFDLASDGLF